MKLIHGVSLSIRWDTFKYMCMNGPASSIGSVNFIVSWQDLKLYTRKHHLKQFQMQSVWYNYVLVNMNMV